ncbi:MAG: protein kinase [Acidobacteriota bacterium]|nr:protein kinase [Acidobacteriota bacterium]
MQELSPDTRLSHYRIVSKIGAGGMGEVYLAEDTRLDRKVALKILPADVASNRDRMERFVREAKAAAALNHPNIAHIYEIGSSPMAREGMAADAAAGEQTHFIAMEFIDGVTLRGAIHNNQAEVGKLLRYLQQVAEGLAKAHAAGIVHRDLKPDNIMISSDGFAKILDFGLAKLIEPQRLFGLSSGASSDDVPTAIMAKPSVAGTIMGTIGYMSPEQARGKVSEIDHRSDIFSFGCILFEAATRQRAFRGQDDLDSLHKIVHGPTPQVKDLDPSAPEQLERIVRRCLSKDPDKRYQSIKDIAIELEELQNEMQASGTLDSFGPVASSWPPPPTLSQPPSRWPGPSLHSTVTSARPSSAEYLFNQMQRHKAATPLLLGAFAIAVAGLAFVLTRVFSGLRTNEEMTSRTVATDPEMKINRLTASGRVQLASISPDGKFLAYVETEGDTQSLWTKQIATNSNLQLAPPAETAYFSVAFTPDGNYIYYTATDGNADVLSIFRVPTLGGTANKILEDGGRGISFSPDGREFVFETYETNAGASSLMIASADGSSHRKLASLSGHEWFAGGGASWSPDGKRIACATGDDRQDRQMTMAVLNAADGSLKALTSQRWDAIGASAWLADSNGIVFCASDRGTSAAKQIWQIAYPSGEARQVTRDLNSYLDVSLTADSKTLVTSQREGTAAIWISRDADLSRAVQVTTGHNDGGNGLAWVGHDRIVYASIASGNTELWIMNANGTGQKQLTNDAFLKYAPAVTPNGRHIVFVSQSGGIHLWRVDVDGSNLLELTNGNFDNNPRISPDGQWVVYSSYLSGKLLLWKVPIGGGEPTQLTHVFATEPDVSPDGKLVACFSNDAEAKRPILMILPLAGGAPIKTLPLPATLDRDSGPRWTPAGDGLTYIERRGNTMNLWLQPLSGAPPRQLTNFKDGGILRREWSPGGKRVAIVRGRSTSDAIIISSFR